MKKQTVFSVVIATLLAGCQQAPVVHRPAPPAPVMAPQPTCQHGDVQMQTTLWFGLSRKYASPISATDWQTFINKDVTLRQHDQFLL